MAPVSGPIARQVLAGGDDVGAIAREIIDGLSGPGLRAVFLFADGRLDAGAIATAVQRGLAPAPVVGGTGPGVIGARPQRGRRCAVALGLYGDWLRVGIGVATDLSTAAPLARSRDAVGQAVASLGLSIDALDPARHVGITIIDGLSPHEEAFCIGTAASAPRARFVGGAASGDDGAGLRARVWAQGEVLADAGVVIVLESALPIEVLRSSHLVPTELRTVVTEASGRIIHQLDGMPAVRRLHALAAQLGATEDALALSIAFARYLDGVPYMRSMTRIEGDNLHIASAVEPGHVLRVMRPGDLIGTTRRDLATAATRVGGEVGALLAFSCISRHWEAAARDLEPALAEAYAAYPVVGLQSAGEQSGMLLVNHTLTGLVIGAPR